MLCDAYYLNENGAPNRKFRPNFAVGMYSQPAFDRGFGSEQSNVVFHFRFRSTPSSRTQVFLHLGFRMAVMRLSGLALPLGNLKSGRDVSAATPLWCRNSKGDQLC